MSDPRSTVHPPPRRRGRVGAFASGVVAAMTMSGLRNLTTALGLLEEIPPREIIESTAPRLVVLLSDDRERAFAEIAHWAYGGICGLAYGEIVRRRPARSRVWGALYGGAVLGLYRAAIAPALGIGTSRRNAVDDQLMLAADHVLFGVVLDDLLRDPS
jgi:hypothetical protein